MSSIVYNLPCQAKNCNQMFTNKSQAVWQICGRCGYRVCHNHSIGTCPQCRYGIIKSFSKSWEDYQKNKSS